MIIPSASRRDIETLLAPLLRAEGDPTAIVVTSDPGFGVTTLLTERVPQHAPGAQIISAQWHHSAAVQICVCPADVPDTPPPAYVLRLVVGCQQVNELPEWVIEDGHMAVELFVVGQLRFTELAEYCSSRLGGSIDLASAHVLGRMSGYVPAMLAWLLGEVRQQGLLVQVEGLWHLTGEVQPVFDAYLRTYLTSVPRARRLAAHRFALEDPAPAENLDDEEEMTATGLISMGVMRKRDDGRLQWLVPGVAESVRRLAPESMVQEVMRASLESGRPTPQAVRWALQQGVPVEDEHFVKLVDRLLRERDYRAALKLVKLSLAKAQPAQILYQDNLLAYEALVGMNDPDEALVHLKDAEAAADQLPSPQREQCRTHTAALRAAAIGFQKGDIRTAVTLLEQAERQAPDEPSAGECAVRRIMLLTYTGNIAEAVQALDSARETVVAAGEALRIRCRIAEAIQMVACGRSYEAFSYLVKLRQRADLVQHSDRAAGEELVAAFSAVALSTDGPAQFTGLITQLGETQNTPSTPETVGFHLGLAFWHWLAGDLDSAHKYAELDAAAAEYGDPAGYYYLLVSLLAATAALRGQDGQAEQRLGQLQCITLRASGTLLGSALADQAVARVVLGVKGTEDWVLETAQSFCESGLYGWASDILYASVRFGGREAAHALIDLEPRLQGHVHALRVQHAQAVVAQDVLAFREVAEQLRKVGLLLFAAEAAALGAKLEAEDPGSRRRCFAIVHELQDLTTLCSHPLLSPLVDDTRPRLTKREVQIQGLIAQGLGNEEIAAKLFLSRRTVENHIASLYRKTGRTRRARSRRSG
ncbi:LuxR C-terminal-related transcriptional regulator [Nesterenkonia ebinurensis]|uniref:LuxR C-terminal-related transcriptional regulator n=1 Tax=Nesterenkonia ebinurensis TaxID=2608252 RepID=UPI00123DF3FB|nr:LuxR family transcriptional regulator [Nesterenkonia ebinurensis]